MRVHKVEHQGIDDLSCIRDTSVHIDGIARGGSNRAGIVLVVGADDSSKAVGFCLLGMHLVGHGLFSVPEAVSFLSHSDTVHSTNGCWIPSFVSLLCTARAPDVEKAQGPLAPSGSGRCGARSLRCPMHMSSMQSMERIASMSRQPGLEICLSSFDFDVVSYLSSQGLLACSDEAQANNESSRCGRAEGSDRGRPDQDQLCI